MSSTGGTLPKRSAHARTTSPSPNPCHVNSQETGGQPALTTHPHLWIAPVAGILVQKGKRLQHSAVAVRHAACGGLVDERRRDAQQHQRLVGLDPERSSAGRWGCDVCVCLVVVVGGGRNNAEQHQRLIERDPARSSPRGGVRVTANGVRRGQTEKEHMRCRVASGWGGERGDVKNH